MTESQAERSFEMSLLGSSQSFLQMRKFRGGKGPSCGHRADKRLGLVVRLQDIPGQGSHQHLCRNHAASIEQVPEMCTPESQGCPCSTAFTGSPLPTKPMPRSLPRCTRPFPQVPGHISSSSPGISSARPASGHLLFFSVHGDLYKAFPRAQAPNNSPNL